MRPKTFFKNGPISLLWLNLRMIPCLRQLNQPSSRCSFIPYWLV